MQACHGFWFLRKQTEKKKLVPIWHALTHFVPRQSYVQQHTAFSNSFSFIFTRVWWCACDLIIQYNVFWIRLSWFYESPNIDRLRPVGTNVIWPVQRRIPGTRHSPSPHLIAYIDHWAIERTCIIQRFFFPVHVNWINYAVNAIGYI